MNSIMAAIDLVAEEDYNVAFTMRSHRFASRAVQAKAATRGSHVKVAAAGQPDAPAAGKNDSNRRRVMRKSMTEHMRLGQVLNCTRTRTLPNAAQ